jgi:hypothetical protein
MLSVAPGTRIFFAAGDANLSRYVGNRASPPPGFVDVPERPRYNLPSRGARSSDGANVAQRRREWTVARCGPRRLEVIAAARNLTARVQLTLEERELMLKYGYPWQRHCAATHRTRQSGRYRSARTNWRC